MENDELSEEELEDVIAGAPKAYVEERLKELLNRREKGEQLTLEELEEVKAGLYQKIEEKNRNNQMGK